MLEPTIIHLMKEIILGHEAAQNLVRRGKNRIVEISIIAKFSLKVTKGCLRYNTITKILRKAFFEWILSNPNVNLSCVSSDVIYILNPESNIKEVFTKMSIYFSVRDLHNDMIKPF